MTQKVSELGVKKCYFVVGPEGCGTYMLAEAFVSGGCIYCDKDDPAEFLVKDQPHRVVIRRSLPHAGKWPDLNAIAEEFYKYAYAIIFIWIVREQNSAELSVSMRRPMETFVPGDKFVGAMQIIGSEMKRFGGRLVTYEAFVTMESYRNDMFKRLGLDTPKMEFYNGNEKYY